MGQICNYFSDSQWIPIIINISIYSLGVTHIPMEVMEDFLNDIKHNYTVQTYSLLSYNCNNFSNEISNFLLGKDIPTGTLYTKIISSLWYFLLRK
jgi:hypothetical protein